MTRRWVLWIWIALFLACVCTGMEEYAEPVTEEASVGEVAPGVADPGSAGGYEGVEPKPEGEYYVTDSGAGSQGEIVEPGPEGEPQVITSGPEGDDQVVVAEVGDVEVVEPKPEGQGDMADGDMPGDTIEVVAEPRGEGEGSVGPELEGEYRIYTMAPGGGDESTDSAPEGEYQILTMGPEGGEALLNHLVADVMASVGMPAQNSELAGLQADPSMVWASVPELAQMRSAIGVGMVAQMAAISEAITQVPSLAGQLDNVISQFSQTAHETFDAFPIPGIVNFPANQ